MLRYAITDRSLFAPQRFADEAERHMRLIERCTALARDGVDFIQLREKDLSPPALTHLAQTLLAAFHRTQTHTRLLINADPRISLSIGADGVHLTSTSPCTPSEVTNLFTQAGKPTPIVSVSCHTLPEVVRACDAGASHILFSPIFHKYISSSAADAASQPSILPGIGLEALAEACRLASPIPVLALGGVTNRNAPACLAAGAAGIAAIRLFMLG